MMCGATHQPRTPLHAPGKWRASEGPPVCVRLCTKQKPYQKVTMLVSAGFSPEGSDHCKKFRLSKLRVEATAAAKLPRLGLFAASVPVLRGHPPSMHTPRARPGRTSHKRFRA